MSKDGRSKEKDGDSNAGVPREAGRVKPDARDLARRIAGLSPEKRSALGKLFRDGGVSAKSLPIPRVDRGGDLPLSFAQRRFWFFEQVEPGSQAYVVPSAFRLSGRVDAGALQRSFTELVRRHEVLRTTFSARGAEPVQVIAPPMDVPLPVDDLSAIDAADRERRALELASDHARRGFDLASVPLIRTRLLRLAEDDHLLVISLHHVAYDGRSVGVLLRELSALYTAFVAGKPSPLGELAIQYADYAAWQREQLGGDGLNEHLSYWRTRLAGTERLQIETDRQRPRVPSYKGAAHSGLLPRATSDAVKELAREEGATPFMVLLAAFSALLHRYTGQDDIVVGSPVAGRTRNDVEDLIGCFVNSLVLRTIVPERGTFRELVRRVRDGVVEALVHQDVPFEKLVDELHPERELGVNPIFQVMFAMQEPPWQGIELPGLTMRLQGGLLTTARVDIEANIWEGPDGLVVTFCYSTDLFEAATIERLLGAYQVLLDAVVERPDRLVSSLPLMGEADTRRAVVDWNATGTSYPQVSMAELFEAQVRRSPDAIAVAYGDGQLTYQELNGRANQLAHVLIERGVGPETFVALFAERSPAMITAMLAIVKAGGTYVPLDTAYPMDRLAFMLGDTGATLLLTEEHLLDRLPQHRATVFCLDRDWSGAAGASVDNPPPRVTPDHLAYVIYTSGSTGRPKGVAVPQRGVTRLVLNTDYVALGPSDRIAQASNAAFDAATFEIWGALLTGARLVGIDKDIALSPAAFAAALRDDGITTLFLTTALFNQIARQEPAGFRPLRQVLFGGEAVDPSSVRRVLEHGAPERLLHVYGPTENTTFSTWHRVEQVAPDALTVPIGRSIANSQLFVVDGNGQPVPVGVVGELLVGGDGLARGYWNRPELTAERFVPSPFASVAGARLYRTGDLVRYLPDGSVEFVGRNDDQVKIRGFRIELGEIDAEIGRHPSIKQSFTIASQSDGQKRLVTYVVPAASGPLAWDDIRSALRERLPDYMVPAVFVELDALPLNPNGKVDRAKLPEPTGERQLQEEFVGPRSGLERQIAAIWRDALQVERVGVRDNFFDLGGHSLLLIQVHARMVQDLGRDLRIVELFEYPTIELLARRLGGDEPASSVQLDARARAGQRGRRDEGAAVAIVGLAGRFPGAPDIETFWSNLRDGVESVRFFTDEELLAAGVPQATLDQPGYVRARGVLDDADLFDAPFFGYTPREAEVLDPQHRVFLECAWEALEDAGCDPDRFKGLIGVYAGAGANSYLWSLRLRSDLLESIGALQAVVGSASDFLPTRLSYKLNLRGPSVNVQTACSTSLVAVHHACTSLLNFECDAALAGGVSVSVPLKSGYRYVEEGILSPDGHCRSFDESARGTVSGNGAAVVVLKRLSDALAAGDRIRAVIRGSAINNDGSLKVGYTAPSVEGQAEVIALAHATAGVDSADISYIEAHGTATPLGDPVEIAALTKAFGDSPRRFECAIGSLKSNVGHLDAAAGVAGLIKTTLALEHRAVPPTLHFVRPNPKIDFDATPFRVSSQLQPWNAPDGGPRVAGVSSFGIGGTNAHVVIEEAPAIPVSGPSRSTQVLCLSARSEAALDATTARLAGALEACADLNLADVAHTLRVGRREWDWRRVVVCTDREDAIEALRRPDVRRVFTQVSSSSRPAVAFMFSGQGAQYPNMGAALYRNEPVFRRHFDECCDRLQAKHALDLRSIVFTSEAASEAGARLARTEVTQPALFAVEYALARLWMSWGVEPDAMIGHSLGEYVAACLAGVFSLEDALDVVAARGRFMADCATGAMLAVDLPEADLMALSPRVAIAAVNGPSLSVASGSMAAIDELEALLTQRGLAPRRLRTSHAFHSAMVEPAAERLREALGRVTLKTPQIPFVSNITGTWIRDDQAIDPMYWARHLREPVRFSEGLATLLSERRRVLLEIGPGHTLAALAGRHPAKSDGHVVLSTLAREADAAPGADVTLAALGRVWLAGVRPDWTAFSGDEKRRKVTLPTYPFERRRYWIDAKAAAPQPAASEFVPFDRWFNVPSWKRSPLPSTSSAAPADCWLVFEDGCGVAAQVADDLRTAGVEPVMVSPGNRFVRLSENAYAIDPSRPQDYAALLDDLARRGSAPLRILHLWTLTADASTASIDDDLQSGFYSVLFLMQALGGQEGSVQVSVVSNHLQDVTGQESLRPAKAAVLGPVLTAALEYPNIFARSVDVSLDSGQRGQVSASILSEASADSRERVVAYRGDYRWVQTLEPVRLPAASDAPPQLRPRGVYLLTGGLGGVSLEIAEFLARSVQARLILVGRSADAAPAESLEKIARIKALGAEVLVCGADVADREAMERVVAQATARFGPINGVIHNAGVPGGSALQRLTRDKVGDVFRPKVAGTMVVDALFNRPGVDFIVLSSSLISFQPLPGRAEYVSANAFVDRFGRRRRANAPAVIVVNWETWREAGMAFDWVAGRKAGGAPRVMTEGMRSSEGVEAFGRILRAGLTHVVLSTRDVNTVASRGLASREAVDDPAAAALPARPAFTSHPRPSLTTEYSAAQTPAERALAQVWEDLLGVAPIGVNDNFFELGGDSVVSIQVIAKANQAGLRLTPKQVFDHQTIGELAALAGAVEPASGRPRPEPAETEGGSLPLTPVQRWFFEQDFLHPQQFNQAVLLSVSVPLDRQALVRAADAVQAAHDALRLRYSQEGGTWRQRVSDDAGERSVSWIDVSNASSAQQRARLAAEGAALHASLNLADGPIFKLAYFDCGAEPGRLLIVVHHLAVDAVSWRVLIEDLTTAYEQAVRGSDVRLPAATTSFRRWARELEQYAQSAELERDLPYWLRLADDVAARIPVDHETGPNDVQTTDTVAGELTGDETRALLHDMPGAHGVHVNEVLLACLARTVADWTGQAAFLVEVEGHGRSAIIDGVDLSRTVGWFTNLYPVRLETDRRAALNDVLKSVKEQLRAVPQQGMGYGLLRYLSASQQVEPLRLVPQADVLFLYLGQQEQRGGDSGLFTRATDAVPGDRHPSEHRRHLIELTLVVREGRLRVAWAFSSNRHRRATIESVSAGFIETLRSAITNSQVSAERAFTPSDFPQAGLDQASLDSLLAKISGPTRR